MTEAFHSRDESRTVARFIVKLALALGGILVAVYFLVPRGESDEDKINAVLDHAAALAGTSNCPAYLPLIDRDPAFSLHYYGTRKSFPGDEAGRLALMHECEQLSNRFLGVKLLIKTKDIQLSGNEATVQVASVWDFSEVRSGVPGEMDQGSKVLQGFRFSLRKRGDAWAIAGVEALNRGEMVQSVLRNLGEYVKP